MGEDIFSLDNILDDSQVNTLELFQDNDTNTEDITVDENTENNNETTEVDAESLFEDNQPESVGSEDDTQENQEEQSSETDDSSPNNSVYSSIAKACYEDDVFPDLDESDIEAVTDADSFKEMMEKQVAARLTDIQKRVSEALENGVEPTEIQQHERTLQFLNSVTDDMISEESDQGEDLRKRIIYQDYINKGFTKERATREVKKAIDNGTDIEDAKDALESNKDFYTNNYQKLQTEAKKQADKIKEQNAKQASALKQSIESDDYLGDIALDKSTRKKILDTLSRTYKDKESGDVYTKLQQYEKEHKADFLKYVATFYTITDGFTNFDKFVKGKVAKETNKSIKELEHKLAGTTRNSNGTLKFISGSSKDKESSPFAAGWKLNL